MAARGIFALLLLLGSVGGCSRDTPVPPSDNTPPRPDPADLPNVIFLTVDTLRADHLALYGYERDTMPAVEAFARTAVVFDNAVVPRGSTRPSYASMLTGLYPFHHGVRFNGTVLHDDLLTLPELLKEHGYHAAAFVSNFVLLGEMSGCDQGFDVYDDRLEEREAHRANYERTSPRTLKAILEWLASDPPQPFFLFTNFIDPHGPYRPPERFREMYRSEQKRELRPEQIPYYQKEPGVPDYYDFVDRYDAEIRYADEALGILIDELKARGLWDDALIVFTADHGESLGEHNVFFAHHEGVYEETARVPLAVRLPKSDAKAGSARRVAPVCSPMDLMPTVVECLQLPCDVPFDGRSLLGVLRGGKADDERAVLVEFPGTLTLGTVRPDFFALRTTTHKLTRVTDRNTGATLRQGLYDLTGDPYEQQRLIVDQRDPLHRGLLNRLSRAIAEVRGYELPFVVTQYEMPLQQRPDFVASRPEQSRTNIKTLTPEQIEKLRGLGYIE